MPLPAAEHSFDLRPVEVEVPDNGENQIVTLGPYTVTLRYQEKIRVGDESVFRLEMDYSSDPLQQRLPNLEKTGMYWETRLDLYHLVLYPQGLAKKTMVSGDSFRFQWRIQPTESGSYQGKLWIYVNFISEDNQENIRVALVARDIEVEGITLLGADAPTIRRIAIAGILICVVVLLIPRIQPSLLRHRRD